MTSRRKLLMGKKKVDFHKLGDELWNIANIFRDDTLKTTEYLEEFSYFLFLKLFDDQERQREELAKLDGKEYKPYLPNELRFYTWAEKIINGEIPINEVVPTVKRIFQELANIKDHDGRDLSLFRRLFRNHIWRIKYGATIRDLLKRLVDLKLEQNFDVMGRAYEFVVQKLGEQKQYGQYFTPRHIIHFMVELADPEIGEKIYDPAAGTGGFILRAFEVISKKIQERYKNDYSLAEKYFRELKEKQLWAVEKAPDVYKLALMNMILHNDGKSNLYEADSLDNRAQIEHKQKYDVVLSNPPYGPLTQSRVGVFDYHTKRFEALFIQHIMNALKFSEPDKKPSRAVVIILDKILFDSTRAFKNIRKKLLREYKLKAVFSMPAGIFQPYSGVKTTVLYFERPTREEWNRIKENNEYATEHILFFDVKSDGFTLSTQRRPINGAFQGDNPNIYNPPCGDLPKAVEVFKEWLKALDSEEIEKFKEKYVDNEQVWIADIEEIKEKDFNLNPGLYRKVEKGKVRWKWVKLGDILENYSVKNKDKEELPVYSVSKEKGIVLAEEIFKENVYGKNREIYEKNLSNYKLIEKGCFVYNPYRINIGSIGYVEHNIRGLVSPAYVVFKVKDAQQTTDKFLYYVLKSDWFLNKIKEATSGSIRDSLSFSSLSEIYIPLPPLEIQKKIVDRLDKQQAIIEKAKEMEKAILDAGIDDVIFEGDWEWVELREVVEISNERVEPKNIENNRVFYIGLEHIESKTSMLVSDFSFTDPKELKSAKNVFSERNVLYGKLRPYLEKVYLPNQKGICSTDILVLTPSDKMDRKYLFYLMKSNYIVNWAIQNTKGAQLPRVNPKDLLKVKIPLPPLEKQKEIIEFLDVQFQTLKKIRQMRENAEKTIKLILEREVYGNGEGTS